MKLSRFLKIISVFLLLLAFCGICYSHQEEEPIKRNITVQEALDEVEKIYGPYDDSYIQDAYTLPGNQSTIDNLQEKLQFQSITILIVIVGVASFLIGLYTGESKKTNHK